MVQPDVFHIGAADGQARLTMPRVAVRAATEAPQTWQTYLLGSEQAASATGTPQLGKRSLQQARSQGSDERSSDDTALDPEERKKEVQRAKNRHAGCRTSSVWSSTSVCHVLTKSRAVQDGDA